MQSFRAFLGSRARVAAFAGGFRLGFLAYRRGPAASRPLGRATLALGAARARCPRSRSAALALLALPLPGEHLRVVRGRIPSTAIANTIELCPDCRRVIRCAPKPMFND